MRIHIEMFLPTMQEIGISILTNNLGISHKDATLTKQDADTRLSGIPNSNAYFPIFVVQSAGAVAVAVTDSSNTANSGTQFTYSTSLTPTVTAVDTTTVSIACKYTSYEGLN